MRVGLIGYPVEHSVSPAMHNAAFQHMGMSDWHYDLLLTPPETVKERIASLRGGDFAGANVTIPHKQAVMEHLDVLVLASRAINAVNTITIEDGQLVGHNTDSAGFLLDLEAHGVPVYDKHALVLGAGGAAHAAALGLSNKGATVTVITRREQAGWDLRNNLRRGVSRQLMIHVQSMSALSKIAPDVDLIVNCTSVGMYPNIEKSIWPEDVLFPHGAVLYDMVYRPRQTLLMKQAEDAGMTVIGGLGMLVQQGALAFELWTGQEAPVDVMYQAAENALRED
ncbi:MAG: shikimate dehydrogenase [Chloroflexi bacterium]|nr:shikimate dehydrogenase [Chloroflexota bacterium]